MSSSCTQAPVWLNGWKHHLGYLCRMIREVKLADPEAFGLFCKKLRIMGASVTDLYTGSLNPDAIAKEVTAHLQEKGLIESSPYSNWIDLASKHFREITLCDGSRWTLLKGKEAGSHLHIHPSRYSPLTFRVKTSILKSALALIAWCSFLQIEELQVEQVNFLRAKYLDLSPVKDGQTNGILVLAMNLRNLCKVR